MKLGLAIIVLFVGFDEDGEDMVAGDIVMDDLLGASPLLSNVEDSAELSNGLSSESSVGKDGMADVAGRILSVPRERNVTCVSGTS